MTPAAIMLAAAANHQAYCRADVPAVISPPVFAAVWPSDQHRPPVAVHGPCQHGDPPPGHVGVDHLRGPQLRLARGAPPAPRGGPPAHASTETRRQDMSEWITSAVLSFGSCRALSISSPEGTRPSIGTVPTGGGYPPNTPCPSAIGRTITCSNHGSEQERQ